jgi:hypothetical protein
MKRMTRVRGLVCVFVTALLGVGSVFAQSIRADSGCLCGKLWRCIPSRHFHSQDCTVGEISDGALNHI